VAKEKVTKEKGHPAWRLPPIGQPLLRCLNSGIHAVACPASPWAGSGLFDSTLATAPALLWLRHPCRRLCWRKGIGILPIPATRPVDPVSPPHRGPCRAAGHPDPHSVHSPGGLSPLRRGITNHLYCRM